jgi:hypothetical protein
LQNDDGEGDDQQISSGSHPRKATGADADIAATVYVRARHHAVPESRRWRILTTMSGSGAHGLIKNHEVWFACADDGAPPG